VKKRKKKFIPEKRDWKKYPSLYNYLTEPSRLMGDLLEVKNVVHGFGYEENITDLEKLFIIHEIVTGYNRDLIVKPTTNKRKNK